MAKSGDVGLFQWGDKNQYWGYRITIKVNGKRKDTTSKLDEDGNPYKTKLQAKKARELKVVELRTPKEENVADAYFYEIWEHYLKNDAKAKAPSTIRRYTSLWENHVKDVFANKRLSEITIADMQNFLDMLYYTNGYKYSYVEGFLKMFYMLFGIAYRLEKVSTERYTRMFLDSGTKLKMPQMTQDDLEENDDDVRVYELYEIHQMEQVLKRGNCYTAFLIGYYTGVRISECFALMWKDYNWETRTLTINKQMKYEEGCFCLGPVKTLTSVRQIDVPNVLHQHFMKLYREQFRRPTEAYLNRKSEIVLDKTKKNVVTKIVGGDFINRKANGELLTINSMKSWQKAIKKETGIDFKFHSLRKTHLTQLAAMNTPIIETMKRAGHKKYSTTMEYYVNSNVESKRQLLDRIEQLTTEEPDIEIVNEDGTKRVVKQSMYVKMQKISAILPH